MFNKPAIPPTGTAKVSFKLKPFYWEQILAITDVELRKMLREPTELFSRAVQPMLWLLIFGQVFSKLRDIPTGGLSYLAFMAPGILAQSVLFSAIFLRHQCHLGKRSGSCSQSDGKIEVINSGIKNGVKKVAKRVAWIPDKNCTGKLLVSFLWLFKSELELSNHYIINSGVI